jgi:hypothetical protein
MTKLAGQALHRDDREHRLGRAAGLSVLAAAAAVAAQQFARGIELLEQTRGILLTEGMEVRSDLGKLRQAAPELAEAGVAFGIMTTQDVLGGWREQFDRIWRSYYQFSNAYNPGVDSLDSRRGLGSPGPAELAMQDSFIHFIQDAWHLKDWLKADRATRSLGKAVEEYADETDSLKICRDLCNATKHLGPRRMGERRTEAGLADYPRYGWVVLFGVKS